MLKNLLLILLLILLNSNSYSADSKDPEPAKVKTDYSKAVEAIKFAKKYEKKGLLASRTNIIPIGFIVSNKKIYISLSNGNLVSVDLLTGKSLDVVKIDGQKISRPYIFNNEMFVIRDNAILKLN